MLCSPSSTRKQPGKERVVALPCGVSCILEVLFLASWIATPITFRNGILKKQLNLPTQFWHTKQNGYRFSMDMPRSWFRITQAGQHVACLSLDLDRQVISRMAETRTAAVLPSEKNGRDFLCITTSWRRRPLQPAVRRWPESQPARPPAHTRATQAFSWSEAWDWKLLVPLSHWRACGSCRGGCHPPGRGCSRRRQVWMNEGWAPHVHSTKAHGLG